MRPEAFTVYRSDSLIGLHLAGVHAGGCCDVAMTPQQAKHMAAELMAAATRAKPPCPECGSRRVDPLLPNQWGEDWECLRCGHRWAEKRRERRLTGRIWRRGSVLRLSRRNRVREVRNDA